MTVQGTEKTLQDAIDTNLNIKFATNRVSNGATITPISGYTKEQCYLLVSMEDAHYGTAYTSTFGDGTAWADNHYAGAIAYYAADGANWKVTCAYGFMYGDSGSPAWLNANCRYLMVCAK